jgi:hypothetical protein
MKRKFLIFLRATFGFLIVSAPTFAHHGSAAYDEKHPVTLKGTVTEFVWANPHTQIYFEGRDGPGKLIRSGWTRDGLKPGDQLRLR